MSRSFESLCLAALLGLVCGRPGKAADPGFSQSPYFSSGAGLDRLTCLAWCPDASGRLFVGLQEGSIHILKGGILQSVPFLRVQPAIRDRSECGLTGICFDPNFLRNGYVYVMVTATDREQKILRYEAHGDFASNRVELIRGLPTLGGGHNGGALVIGIDGKLYWGIGDCAFSVGSGQDLTSLASKIGRSGLDGTIPSGNPFADGPGGNNDYVFARGFRNPFKAAVQPHTGALWVSVTGAFYEQIFCIKKGDHAGGQDYENRQPAGYCRPKIKYATGTFERLTLAATGGAVRTNNLVTFKTLTPHNFCEGEKLQVASVNNTNFNGPVYVASVTGDTQFTANQPGPNAASGGGTVTTADMGRAVTGCTFYNATGFPPDYRNNFFFTDYASWKIHRARINSSNKVVAVDLFGMATNAPVDMAVGPDGNLYCAGHWGGITRIAYVSTTQNLVVSPAFLNMAEGGEAVFHVRLAVAPTSNVSVGINRVNGSAAITTSTASLSFTPNNFNVPQPVFVSASADEDSMASESEFAITSNGVSAERVTVHAFDSDARGIKISAMAGFDGQTHLKVSTPENTKVILESSTNLISWIPFSTNATLSNSVTVTAPRVATEREKYYRAVNLP